MLARWSDDSVASDCLKPSEPTGEGPTEPGLPAGFKGFSKPRVSGRTGNLTVTFRNTHSAPITVRLSGSERDGLHKAAAFKATTRAIPAGGRLTFKIATPRRLRARLARQLASRGKAVRRPSLTLSNTATSGRLVTKPRITLRRARRG